MTYGQEDYARRAEEQRRADEARRFEDQRQQEQKRYEQQKADDDRRFYERKLETERQNQAYADRKKREGAEIDAREGVPNRMPIRSTAQRKMRITTI